MHAWRQFHWHRLASVVLLLVLLGQYALLLHETGHSSAVGDAECQLCLHAQPNIAPNDVAPVPMAYLARIGAVLPQTERPIYFFPVYANSSRGPPRA